MALDGEAPVDMPILGGGKHGRGSVQSQAKTWRGPLKPSFRHNALQRRGRRAVREERGMSEGKSVENAVCQKEKEPLPQLSRMKAAVRSGIQPGWKAHLSRSHHEAAAGERRG